MLVILLKVVCQEVVELDIKHDAAVAAKPWCETCKARTDQRVLVGVGINRSMQVNAVLYGRWELTFQSAFHVVAKDGTQQQWRFIACQCQVSQVIHGGEKPVLRRERLVLAQHIGQVFIKVTVVRCLDGLLIQL